MSAAAAPAPGAATAALAAGALSGDATAWKGASVVSVNQFTRAGVELLCARATALAATVADAGGCDLLQRRILANVFFEPSTRTSCSFAAAMMRLGGQVLQISESSSSAKKGETLADTMRCLECYADVLVLRHPRRGAAVEAATACSKPVLNAGDGTGEHPTQALLDIFTIISEKGTADNLTVTLLGTPRAGVAWRAARSQFPPNLAQAT